MCEIALEIRELIGYEIGRLPADQSSRGRSLPIVAPWRARGGRGTAPPPGRGLDLPEALAMAHNGIVYLLGRRRPNKG